MGMEGLYNGEAIMSNLTRAWKIWLTIFVYRSKLELKTSCHSPFSIYFRAINGILQNLTPFGVKISTPECSSIIPVKISHMLFQRLETVISMLL